MPQFGEITRLASLASALYTSEEEITFDTWASHYLSYDESRRPEVPDRSTPMDAPLYAQGYLEERIDLQPNRQALPQDEGLWQFCWDYHQGRHLTFNIAGNSPNLPPGTQLGITDRRALTAPNQKGAALDRQFPISWIISIEGEETLLVYVPDTQSTAATFTDTDVTTGVQHAYRVKAINAAGAGPVSNFVNVTP